ncbi:FaeA/PapI family transcriptional regulator [Chloracidobacterium aggregatum]|uniref:FaeA/PapI family transcriptional regulator n=1 Tax=Chloracidobacterium aggregatum TaxID=2851959 RepID=UPI0031B86497
MVLQYLERHGSTDRGEVAELCKIGPMQAYRLLKRLEKTGKIRRVAGSTKGTRYGLPSK